MAHRKKWVVPRFSREEIESKSPLFLASEGWSSRGTNAEKKCAARSGRLFRVFPLFTSVRSVEWQSLRNRRRQNRIGHLRCVRKDHLQSTGLTREAKTDDSGHYLVPLLPVSLFTIHVEAQGFQT